MSATKVIIGKGACKHPNGRGKPSREFTIDGVGYYFCYGWTNDWGEDISHHCEDCPAHIDVADDVLNKLIEARKRERDHECSKEDPEDRKRR